MPALDGWITVPAALDGIRAHTPPAGCAEDPSRCRDRVRPACQGSVPGGLRHGPALVLRPGPPGAPGIRLWMIQST
eukprot:13536323-Alexandrium_andersonii.AAC.1